MKRALAIGAFVLSLVPAVPALLLLLLFLFNSVNPMTLMFVTTFDVRNDSGEPLRIWVAGTGESGRLGLLPLYATTLPAIPTWRTGGFFIEPGRSARVNYDWDDHNFTLILVKRENGTVLAMPVDADDRKPGCCYRHREDMYVLPPLANLREATPSEVELLRQLDSMWLKVVLTSLVALVPAYLYRVQRRLRQP